MNLFDAHCHLQDARLAKDRAGVLSRARAVGVNRIAIKGASEADWSEVELLVKSDSFLYFFWFAPLVFEATVFRLDGAAKCFT